MAEAQHGSSRVLTSQAVCALLQICAIYHLILAVFSVCTGGTARFVAPIIAGFFTTVQLAVVAVAFQVRAGMHPTR